jgi:hypothetical protein
MSQPTLPDEAKIEEHSSLMKKCFLGLPPQEAGDVAITRLENLAVNEGRHVGYTEPITFEFRASG